MKLQQLLTTALLLASGTTCASTVTGVGQQAATATAAAVLAALVAAPEAGLPRKQRGCSVVVVVAASASDCLVAAFWQVAMLPLLLLLSLWLRQRARRSPAAAAVHAAALLAALATAGCFGVVAWLWLCLSVLAEAQKLRVCAPAAVAHPHRTQHTKSTPAAAQRPCKHTRWTTDSKCDACWGEDRPNGVGNSRKHKHSGEQKKHPISAVRRVDALILGVHANKQQRMRLRVQAAVIGACLLARAKIAHPTRLVCV